MSCITYLHNDPFDSGGTKFISGTTCDGVAEVWNLSFGESACLESELPMIICDGLTISGDCNSDCICWPRGTGAFGGGNGNVIDLSYDPNLNRIYVAGDFGTYSGVSVIGFTCISSSTGNLIGGNFSTSLFNTTCYDVKVQSDSKILVGGAYTTFSSSSQNRLVRLNTNGTKDNTFNIGTGFNNDVQIIYIDSNDKILVGGRFTQFNGVNKGGLVRLNQDGTLDPTFSGLTSGFTDGSAGVYNMTWEIGEYGGQYYITGDFGTFNGVACNDVVRLNQNGSLDNTFNAISFSGGSRLIALTIQSDGRPILGDDIRVVRLNLDGSVDGTFSQVSGMNEVNTLESLPDGTILVGGRSQGIRKKLGTTGAFDPSFTSPIIVALNSPFNGVNTIVPYGECILIGGRWISIDGFIGQGIAKLFSDGELNMCNPIAVTPTPTPTTTRTPTPTPTIPLISPTTTSTPTQTPTQTIGLSPTPTSTLTPTPTQTQGIEIFTHGTVFATCSDFCNANYQIDVSTPATANFATLTFGDTIFGQGGVAGFVAYAATSTDTSTGTFRIAEIDSSGEIIDILVCSGGSCVPL
jgi:uncharacterized delta-60 repeat protein